MFRTSIYIVLLFSITVMQKLKTVASVYCDYYPNYPSSYTYYSTYCSDYCCTYPTYPTTSSAACCSSFTSYYGSWIVPVSAVSGVVGFLILLSIAICIGCAIHKRNKRQQTITPVISYPLAQQQHQTFYTNSSGAYPQSHHHHPQIFEEATQPKYNRHHRSTNTDLTYNQEMFSMPGSVGYNSRNTRHMP